MAASLQIVSQLIISEKTVPPALDLLLLGPCAAGAEVSAIRRIASSPAGAADDRGAR